jgi:hypothetical protein
MKNKFDEKNNSADQNDIHWNYLENMDFDNENYYIVELMMVDRIVG